MSFAGGTRPPPTVTTRPPSASSEFLRGRETRRRIIRSTPKSIRPGGWVLGRKFPSHRSPGRTGEAGDQLGASATTLEGRDRQQELVLDALRRAAGAPVSFAELREAGVELPASVVSELELAGVGIQRCAGEERGVVAVRLDPASEPAPSPIADAAEPLMRTQSEPESSWNGVRVDRRRALTLTVVLAGIALVTAVVAISAGQGGGGHPPAPIAKRPHRQTTVATTNQPPRSTRTPTKPPPEVPVPVSPALATQLEAQGHDLLESGQYSRAVPVLKRAVLATGETVGACVEPANTTCLTYAYALYDLGRAERLSGEPQAAVPILERRLQIDNQRSTVVAELQLARQGIS
jgi:hypothetical protein